MKSIILLEDSRGWKEEYVIGIHQIDKVYSEEDRMHGISITEEWLLKLGFRLEIIDSEKHYTSPWFYDAKQLVIELYQNKARVKLFDNIVSGTYTMILNRELEYVHQLQNMYFSLADIELTIKE